MNIRSIINEFKRSYVAIFPLKIYDASITKKNGCVFFLIREGLEKKLVIVYPPKKREFLRVFSFKKNGQLFISNKKFEYIICSCDGRNASALRKIFPFTRPQPMGLTPAIGLGDRLGLTTPGHIRAIKKSNVFPFLAQQSFREMERTLRTPKEVLDDVSWAVFQEGYRGGFGSDADHIKREKDVYAAFQAGFTMYTVDPSDYVDIRADNYVRRTLEEKFNSLPWNELKIRKERFLKIYLNKRLILRLPYGETREINFSEESLMRVAVKFSAAILFTLRIYRQLRKLFGRKKFDFEVSIDETEKPTTALEHFFIASELKRLGVRFHSLAPKFIGKFEKAIDYIGDLEKFKESFIEHVLISKICGPYKISIHSGSDKFSVYPIISEIAPEIIHLKTSGTSYLEALRVIARYDPKLFRRIVKHSLKYFKIDRKSYHVSADPNLIPEPESISDEDLEKVFLDNNAGRQILHVTFGSILSAKDNSGRWIFREDIKRVLLENEEEFYEIIVAHIKKHIEKCFLR
ncbi:hypothetical protein J7L29_07705 [Candidatus Bathyarchaeota archaeon]|nr:hypothetical protein [Candidatus Bathyarchaeota archaeon]